jgi:anaerobic selenocysteine-containing dehydrogenase
MHELIVHDWLDHDYIERHVDGWPALRERALQWPPERAAAVCGITADEVRQLARDYGTTRAGGDPPELRHAARARRRQCGAAGGAAALPGGRLAPPRRRAAAVGVGLVQGRAQRRRAAAARPAGRPPPRTINMSTIGDDLLREASPAFGPRIEALVVYNSNPVAVAPDSRQVVQGFAREDLFTVVLEHFLTDTADHADYRAAGHHAAGALGRARQLRPHLRADQPAGDAAAGPGAQNARSSARWPRAWASPNPASATATRPWPAAFKPEVVDFDHCARAAG